MWGNGREFLVGRGVVILCGEVSVGRGLLSGVAESSGVAWALVVAWREQTEGKGRVRCAGRAARGSVFVGNEWVWCGREAGKIWRRAWHSRRVWHGHRESVVGVAWVLVVALAAVVVGLSLGMAWSSGVV